jgi:hypothetical protein
MILSSLGIQTWTNKKKRRAKVGGAGLGALGFGILFFDSV